jgi:hypothetical protein
MESEQFRGRGSIGQFNLETVDPLQGGYAKPQSPERLNGSVCLAGPVLIFLPARVLFGTSVRPETEKRTHAQIPSTHSPFSKE